MTPLSRREFLRAGPALTVSVFPRVRSASRQRQVENGRTFHIAPDGDDRGPGTENRPFQSLKPLATSHGDGVQDGDTIYLHDGTYTWSERLIFDDVTGILLTGYGSQKPIIDAEEVSGTANSHGVFQFFDGSDCTVSGIEITNSPGPAIDFDDSENPVIEGCVIHHAGGAGIQYNGCEGGAIRDCEVYAGFGPLSAEDGSNVGGDSDGIQVTGTQSNLGQDTIVEYNSCHHNSDDGFDFYHSTNLVVRYNIAYANGFRLNGEPAGKAPGKGIKLGSSTATGDGGHLVHNNAAWSNGHSGIGWNGADVPVSCYNNTCIGNGQKAELLDSVHGNDFTFYDADSSCHVYNNIGEMVGENSYIDNIDAGNVDGNSWQIELPEIEELVRSTARSDAGVPTRPDRYLEVPPSSAAVDAGIDLDTDEFPDARRSLGAVTEDLPYLGSRSVSYVTTPTSETPTAIERTLRTSETPTTSSSFDVPGLFVGSVVAGIAVFALDMLRRRFDERTDEDDPEQN